MLDWNSAARRLAAALYLTAAATPGLAFAEGVAISPSDQPMTRATFAGHALDLEVRCQGARLAASVSARGYINSSAATAVTYRFDGEPPRQELWSASSEGRSVSSRTPRAFIAQAIKASTVAIEVEDFKGSKSSATFNLAGNAASLEQVLNACPDAPADPPATPVPAGPKVVASPDWMRRPTTDQILRLYPERAARLDSNGDVVLSCTVMETGGLTACSVVSETPKGLGFAEAALRASRYYQLRPRTADGASLAGAMVQVGIPFRVE